ncbi:MAG: hypothetical protein ABSG90_13715 [Dehalococcoidia bacterium]
MAARVAFNSNVRSYDELVKIASQERHSDQELIENSQVPVITGG